MRTMKAVGREDRAMLRSNPSARADARAWAAVLASLLIFAPHAWAANAINLNEVFATMSPTGANLVAKWQDLPGRACDPI